MTTFTDFWEKCQEIKSGYMVAAMTDAYLVDVWPMEQYKIDEAKLLEMRVFNTEQERKLFRSDISKEFVCREIRDTAENDRDYSDYYDEYQYLDIDTKRSEKSFREDRMVYTTGGGRYHLPLSSMEDVMVQIRMYFERYPETGQARVFDWRVVDFVREQEVKKDGKKR